MTELTLAWRNIWRNRRRSLITMGAVLFGVVIIAVTRSLQYGTYDAMESYAIRMFSGDLQVHAAGYHDEPSLMKSLQAEQIDADQRLDRPWVDAYARRLIGYGLVSTDSTSAGTMIAGVEPDREPRVTTFLQEMARGQSLTPSDSSSVVLGHTLAENLSVDVGDTVAVLTQGYHNVTGAGLYAVKGIVRSGSLEMDRSLMVMPLSAVQSLFSMPGRFTHLVVRTDDFHRADRYAAALREALPADQIEVMSWNELQPELRQMILLDNASGAIFLLFLLMLVGFEIFNTTAMSVMERTREFGMMQAVGMKPRQISLLVAIELLIKITMALAGGLLVALILASIFKNHPIPLGEDFQEVAETYGFPMTELTFSTGQAVFLEPLVGVAAISVLSMIYPIWRTLRLEPTDALRAP